MPSQSLTYKVLFVKPLAWWLLIWALRASCRLPATRCLFNWSGGAVRALKTGQFLPWCADKMLLESCSAAAAAEPQGNRCHPQLFMAAMN